MTVTDRWILSRLAGTAAAVTDQLDEFKYSEPTAELYRFFWNEFCDWYLEWVKPRMQDEEQKPIAQNVLAFVLDQILRLLHPFVPFITEGIFQRLNEIAPLRRLQGLTEAESSDALVVAKWPDGLSSLTDEEAEEQVSIIQKPVRAIRDIKNKYNIPYTTMVTASVTTTVRVSDVLASDSGLICSMAGLKELTAGPDIVKPGSAATAIIDDMQIYVHDVIDPEAERGRLEKHKQEVEKAKKAVEAKLNNENFVKKAKPEVVARAREKLAELVERLKTVEKNLSQL
ncbi:MAG: class I tRNA ligase family protein [Planctomycetota bacterium]